MTPLMAEILWMQIALFVVVGLLNTGLDFLVYNLLTRPPLNLSRIISNICSTTIAMVFSFVVNFVLVFQPTTTNLGERAVKFVIVTSFSLYVIQTAVIHFTSKIWLGPVRLATRLTQLCPPTRTWSDEFVSKNTVKVLATFCSLIWNFVFYKFVVYAN